MQTVLLAALPPGIDSSEERTASQWRSLFVQAGIGQFDDWNAVRIAAAQRQLWIIAGEPSANAFLTSHLDAIAGVLASACNGPVPLEVNERAVGVRAGTDKLWAYRIPKLVVEKKPGDWSAHFAAQIDPALKSQIERKVERALRRELDTWGRLPSELDNDLPFLVLSQPGRAVPISAISGQRSGHGKAVTVLTRLHPVFLSYWRLEGHLFAGPLASLGFGRIVRMSAPDMIDRATQKALLDILPTTSSEVMA